MQKIDKVQQDVMEALKGCKLDKIEVANIMLSIAYSIAEEVVNERRTYRTPMIFLKKKISELDAVRRDGI